MRGYLKRLWRRVVVARHVRRHGGFQYQGMPISVPDNLHAGIQALIASGHYEDSECTLIERHLPRDLPVIELGGCLGLVSSVISRHLGAGVRHIVVEANPDLAPHCRSNASLGGRRKDTVLVEKAVAYCGPTVAFDFSDNIHISRLSDQPSTASTEVAAVRLADLVADLGLPSGGRFALVCDIEGAEVDIIEHDAASLALCDTLIMELHPHVYARAATSLDAIVARIAALGLGVVGHNETVYAFKRQPAAGA